MRAEWKLNGKFVVGYSGNLGRAHEFETMLEAAAQIEATSAANQSDDIANRAVKPPDMLWLFIGGGAQFDLLKAEVVRRGLRSFLFKPYQRRERLASSLSAADVHLVTLRSDLEGLIVPSKFYGIAAAGRPTVFIGDPDGEIGRLLTKQGCGVSIRQSDARGLAELLTALASDPDRCRVMGARAREASEMDFDKSVAI